MQRAFTATATMRTACGRNRRAASSARARLCLRWGRGSGDRGEALEARLLARQRRSATARADADLPRPRRDQRPGHPAGRGPHVPHRREHRPARHADRALGVEPVRPRRLDRRGIGAARPRADHRGRVHARLSDPARDRAAVAADDVDPEPQPLDRRRWRRCGARRTRLVDVHGPRRCVEPRRRARPPAVRARVRARRAHDPVAARGLLLRRGVS